jgi:hypothetical protein
MATGKTIHIRVSEEERQIIEDNRGLNNVSAFIKGCINFYLTHNKK